MSSDDDSVFRRQLRQIRQAALSLKEMGIAADDAARALNEAFGADPEDPFRKAVRDAIRRHDHLQSMLNHPRGGDLMAGVPCFNYRTGSCSCFDPDGSHKGIPTFEREPRCDHRFRGIPTPDFEEDMVEYDNL